MHAATTTGAVGRLRKARAGSTAAAPASRGPRNGRGPQPRRKAHSHAFGLIGRVVVQAVHVDVRLLPARVPRLCPISRVSSPPRRSRCGRRGHSNRCGRHTNSGFGSGAAVRPHRPSRRARLVLRGSRGARLARNIRRGERCKKRRPRPPALQRRVGGGEPSRVWRHHTFVGSRRRHGRHAAVSSCGHPTSGVCAGRPAIVVVVRRIDEVYEIRRKGSLPRRWRRWRCGDNNSSRCGCCCCCRRSD